MGTFALRAGTRHGARAAQERTEAILNLTLKLNENAIRIGEAVIFLADNRSTMHHQQPQHVEICIHAPRAVQIERGVFDSATKTFVPTVFKR